MTKHENMLLTATEKQIIINYRKTDKVTKKIARVVLDMEKMSEKEHGAAEDIISFAGRRHTERG